MLLSTVNMPQENSSGGSECAVEPAYASAGPPLLLLIVKTLTGAALAALAPSRLLALVTWLSLRWESFCKVLSREGVAGVSMLRALSICG